MTVQLFRLIFFQDSFDFFSQTVEFMTSYFEIKLENELCLTRNGINILQKIAIRFRPPTGTEFNLNSLQYKVTAIYRPLKKIRLCALHLYKGFKYKKSTQKRINLFKNLATFDACNKNGSLSISLIFFISSNRCKLMKS